VKGGGLCNLVCDTMPTLGVEEGSDLQDTLGKVLGFSERR
jgi:hypothetical protein